MRKMSLWAGFFLVALLGAVTIALAADPGTEDPSNWPQFHRTANAWRYSPLDQISKETIGKLSVAWIAPGDRWRGLFHHVGQSGRCTGWQDRAGDLEV